MRWKLPQQVKVGGRTYAVKTCPRLTDDRDREGECDFAACEIRLQEGMLSDRERKAWLHELLHAVCKDRHVKLTEIETYQLAIGIAAVIVDNGWKLGE